MTPVLAHAVLFGGLDRFVHGFAHGDKNIDIIFRDILPHLAMARVQ